MTVEHLLLAIVDTPEGPGDLEVLRGRYRQAQDRTEAVHRSDHAAAAGGRGSRRPAHPRLPTRAAARCLSRSIERQEGSHRGERAGRDFQREAVPCGPTCSACRTCRVWMWSISSRTGLSKAGGEERSEREEGKRPRRCGTRRRRRRQRPGEVCDEPQRGRTQGQDRPADRAQARGGAHHRDPVPAAQEQSSICRRSRRRQDGHRRRPGPHDRREPGSRRVAGRDDLLPGHGFPGRRHPSTAATSRSG